jgi:hypothetical protein
VLLQGNRILQLHFEYGLVHIEHVDQLGLHNHQVMSARAVQIHRVAQSHSQNIPRENGNSHAAQAVHFASEQQEVAFVHPGREGECGESIFS